MDEAQNGVSWMHRLASFVAVMTFLLIVFGGLVTSSNTSLSTPRWPWVYDSSRAISSAQDVKFGHDFSISAGIVSLSTIILSVWVWMSSAQRYVKVLGGLAVLALMALAALTGAGSAIGSPIAIYVAYVGAVQVLFCLTVAIALVTRTDWRWDEPKSLDVVSPSLRHVLVFTTGAIFAESILGAAFHYRQSGIAFHFLSGVVISVCALWALEMTLTKFSAILELKIPAILLGETVVLELLLGIVAYSMGMNARAQALANPLPGTVIMSETHTGIGALALAASLFVTFQAFKYLAPQRKAAAITRWPEKTLG